MPYPVVLKPRASEELTAGTFRTAGRPSYARNAREFDDAYRSLSTRSSAVLVQEFVRGEGTGYFALMHHGELRAEFAHQRIRDVHPTGRGAQCGSAWGPIRKSDVLLWQFFSALQWHGVAMVEYRKEASSRPVFMEGQRTLLAFSSFGLLRRSGLSCSARPDGGKGDIEPSVGYRRGVRCRWLLGDARHLVEVWKGPPVGYPGEYPGRLRTLVDVFTPFSGTYHDLFQWSDPLPELGDWA